MLFLGPSKVVTSRVLPNRDTWTAMLSNTSPEGAVPVSCTKATDIESSAKTH